MYNNSEKNYHSAFLSQFLQKWIQILFSFKKDFGKLNEFGYSLNNKNTSTLTLLGQRDDDRKIS